MQNHGGRCGHNSSIKHENSWKKMQFDVKLCRFVKEGVTVARKILVIAAASHSTLLGGHHGRLASRGHRHLCGLGVADVARITESFSVNPGALVDAANEGIGEEWVGPKGRGSEQHVGSEDG